MSNYKSDVNVQLLIASYEGNCLEIRSLLEKGADPAALSDCGASPIVVSIQHRNACCTFVLLKRLYSSSDNNHDFYNISNIRNGLVDTVPNCICQKNGFTHKLSTQRGDSRWINTCGDCKNNGCLDTEPLHLFKLSQNRNLYNFPMVTAASIPLPLLVDRLIQGGEDPGSTDGNGFNMLQVLVSQKNLKFLECLLKSGVNPNSKAKRHYTALHTAAGFGQNQTILLLLRYGADLNARSSESYSPLICAFKEQCYDTAKLLINIGADVGPSRHFIDKHDLLMESVMANNSSLVSLVLQRNTDPLSIMKAYQFATERCGEEILAQFLDLEVDLKFKYLPNVSSSTIFNAYELALSKLIRRSLDLAKFYLSKRPIPKNDKALITVINTSRTRGSYLDAFDLLIKHGLLDENPMFLVNALVSAFNCGDAFIVRHLIGLGANVHAAVHIAALKQNLNVTQLNVIIDESVECNLRWLLRTIREAVKGNHRREVLPMLSLVRQTPLSLSVLCRRLILHFFAGSNYYKCVDQLPLPKRVKCYLKFRTLDDTIISKNIPLRHVFTELTFKNA